MFSSKMSRIWSHPPDSEDQESNARLKFCNSIRDFRAIPVINTLSFSVLALFLLPTCAHGDLIEVSSDSSHPESLNLIKKHSGNFYCEI